MDSISYLESIIVEAREALSHANAGGRRKTSFDAHTSINSLHSAFNALYDLNASILEDINE